MPSSAVKLEGEEDTLGESGKASGSDPESSSPLSLSELAETDERSAGGGKARKSASDKRHYTGRKVSQNSRVVLYSIFVIGRYCFSF